ncbi:MAG: hypothetical protein NT165_02875 [Candidatus Falkowbacteria bacterium]|nr:hypothetical protein [Candidatus Falkowbacteria bacterium]
MVSPTLMRRSESARGAELNLDAKHLFQVINSDRKKGGESNDDAPKISVSEMISKLSFAYEKIRNAVDYEEDHLLRKNAIIRILKRQVVIEGVLKESNSEQIATHLLAELIRAGYLPNNKLPESKIKETALLLEKYIRLKDHSVAKINALLNLKTDLGKAKDLIGEKNSVISWILSLAACEIEENFDLNRVKQTIVSNMFAVLSKNLELPESLPYKDDLEIQTYLSINRIFLRFDKAMLSLILFKYYHATWSSAEKNNLSDEEIDRIADTLPVLHKAIDEQLDHPLVKPLDRIVKVYSLYYNILLENVQGDPVKAYEDLSRDENKFLGNISKTCAAKYQREKNRLWRKAFRSIIYIFLTKSIFVFLIEVPAIKWFNEPLNPVALAINVCFPAVLLFFIVIMSRMPDKKNTEKIISGVKEIALAGSERTQPIMIRVPKKRQNAVDFFFNIIYTAAFFASTYFIIWVLSKAHFNWVSITIFMFFLAFVSFFSIIVTKDVKDLIIVARRESLLGFLIDLFYMPIIAVGKWLSSNVSKVNVFVFLFDFVIEAPFKVLVEIAEDWTRYVKERKDNML